MPSFSWIKAIGLALGLGLVGASAARAQQEPYSFQNQSGVGLTLGTVSGLNVYHRPSEQEFVQGLLGFGGSGNYYLGGDYCLAYPGMFKWRPLVPYFCGGAFLARFGRSWDRFPHDDEDRKGKTYLGGRIPVGAQIFIPKTPLQAFLEVGPSLFLIPETEVFLQGETGLRIMF